MTIKKFLPKILLLIGAICLAFSLVLATYANALPITGLDMQMAANASTISKVQALKGSSVGTVTNVSVPGKFSYRVVQSGNGVPSGYELGQYAQATKKGSIGLLAHNYLAGQSFFMLAIGDEVIVTYANNTTETFVVTNILRFQATDPTDYSRPFLNSNGSQVSATKVYNQAFHRNWLTFQTCIFAEGSSTWGLLFVQAVQKK